jgi:hypothetical protein
MMLERFGKESLELRHECRNTRVVSLLLRNLLQEQRKLPPMGSRALSLSPSNPVKLTDKLL